MVRDVIFNNRSLQSFGFYLTKDISITEFGDNGIDTTSIVGANNGDALSGFETWRNVEKTYTFKTIPSKIPYSEDKFLKIFVDWIQSNRLEYGKLTDTARKGYFQKAFIKSVSGLEKSYSGCYKVSITFSCKPFYYLNTGQIPIQTTIVGSTETEIHLHNPEIFIAYPIIEVRPSRTGGDGAFQINTDEMASYIKITRAIEPEIIIDSENKKINNWSEFVSYISGTTLPFFVSGDNIVNFKGTSGTTYDIKIIPNWRCL